MALFHGDIYSLTMDKMTTLHLYLPGDDVERFGVECPQKTLILLHGLEANASYWMRYSSVERYAQTRNLALVMPECELSLYADMKNGLPYATWIGKELPDLIHTMFGLNTNRDSLSIAGLSAGGYGAIRLALTYPERFGKCASFSGTLMTGSRENLQAVSEYTEIDAKEKYEYLRALDRSLYYAHRGTFGEQMEYVSENDILALAQNVIDSGKPIPELLLTCGTKDFLYYINHTYQEKLKQMGLPIQFAAWDGGHDWKFWDESIRNYIDFF